ncbi:MAG: hypothetical protein IJJ44_13110, partial [Solobacterium sp.]|nr:hypothetical protein [Solobacterium sp.]
IADLSRKITRKVNKDTGIEDYKDCADYGDNYARFFDIEIWSGDQKIEPKADVSVNIQLHDAPADTNANPNVVHFAEEGPEVMDIDKTEEQVEDEESASEAESISFAADGFSVYGVVYTVDFHWEVNGKMYDFSIKGGETLSLRKLLEILNVVDAEKSQEFIDHISTVEFTNPDLICVAKIEEDITAGELKDSLDLEPEYSEEVSEDELAEMDSVQLKSVDWALISLKPFDSEEWLTVSMTDGEMFSIKVTDSRDPLGLDGRTFAILTKKVGTNGTSGHTLQAGVHTTKDSRGYYMTSLNVDLNNGTQYTVVDGVEYVRQDATAWKFEYNAEKEAYYISNNGKYLYIDPSVTSKNDTPPNQNHAKEHALNLVDSKDQADEGTLITITRDSSGNYYFGNKKGTLLWDYGSGYWLSNPENGETDLKENNAAIHLCLPENPNGSHKATLTAAKDLSVGQSVIVYKKIWNYETDEYDFFAVDANGKLVKVWESSDAVYWKENNGTSPAIEWKLIEATNAEGNPTGYLYLEQEVNGSKVYLSPHHDNNVVHSVPDSELNTVRISLPGRDLEQYGSRIAAWDNDANTTYG